MNSLPTVSNISKITAQAIQSYCTTKSQEVKTIICVCVLHNMMPILGLLRLWELLYLLSVSSRVISKHFHLFCFVWFVVDLVFLFRTLSVSLFCLSIFSEMFFPEKWLRWMCVETYFTITASRLLYPAAPRSHAHSYSRRWVLAWPPASFPGKILTPAFRGVCSQGPISNEAALISIVRCCVFMSQTHTH